MILQQALNNTTEHITQTGEITRQLRAPTTLTEDQVPVLIQGGSQLPIPQLQEDPCTHVHKPTHRHTHVHN